MVQSTRQLHSLNAVAQPSHMYVVQGWRWATSTQVDTGKAEILKLLGITKTKSVGVLIKYLLTFIISKFTKTKKLKLFLCVYVVCVHVGVCTYVCVHVCVCVYVGEVW